MSSELSLAILMALLPCVSLGVVARTLVLDKDAYACGEPIEARWTGSANSNDTIAIIRRGWDAATAVRDGKVELWADAQAASGTVAFTTPLPPGAYAAYLLEAGGPHALTTGFPFRVSMDPGTKHLLDTRILVGPDQPGGALADPQVFRDNDTYYLTGTYSGEGGYIYATTDFETMEATWMEIDTKPWPYPYQHIWAFEIYRHSDGSYHGYAFDFDRKGLYHFLPDPDPDTRAFPVRRWKEKERLLNGDYDNRVVRDGDDLYMLSAKGDGAHISIYCQRMLDPGRMDTNDIPRKILSGHGDGLASELRNQAGLMKIHECPYIMKVSAPGGTKYVLSYTVGDYGIRDYKIGLAYSDVMIPPRGVEYTKATLPDALNVWGSGAGTDEVVYVTQSHKPSWPNYHADVFNRPGSGDLVEYKGDHYMVFHAAAPLQMEGMTGTRGYDPSRMAWIMPLTFDFRGAMPTWATPGLPARARPTPSLRTEKAIYAPHEEIVIHFDHAGQGPWDWVGLFEAGTANDAALVRRPVHGTPDAELDVWKWERTPYGFKGASANHSVDTVPIVILNWLSITSRKRRAAISPGISGFATGACTVPTRRQKGTTTPTARPLHLKCQAIFSVRALPSPSI